MSDGTGNPWRPHHIYHIVVGGDTYSLSLDEEKETVRLKDEQKRNVFGRHEYTCQSKKFPLLMDKSFHS